MTQHHPDEEDIELYQDTLKTIDESIKYMMNLWSNNDPEHNRINYKCRNVDNDCSRWAAQGECESNEEWMQVNCAPACQTCHLLDIRLKCPIEDDNEMIYQPGDLNALMERIVDNSDGKGTYLKYNPKAISRPKLKADGTPAPGVEVDGPWIVQFENFVSQKEAETLIAAGAKKGYERSADVGEENPDGTHQESVNEGRTSENAWCDEELCNEDPIIRPVIERISSITESSAHNSEHLQLLRYSEGQFYQQHHDYIEYQQELPCGPRALTLFLYLNDVEEGGGTHFPLLDITVQPKMGNAILWPSVLDDDPEAKDFRTDHEALPVIKGIKYGEWHTSFLFVAMKCTLSYTSYFQSVFATQEQMLGSTLVIIGKPTQTDAPKLVINKQGAGCIVLGSPVEYFT
jgi:prolyl 4-hydroxylase